MIHRKSPWYQSRRQHREWGGEEAVVAAVEGDNLGTQKYYHHYHGVETYFSLPKFVGLKAGRGRPLGKVEGAVQDNATKTIILWRVLSGVLLLDFLCLLLCVFLSI